MKRFKFLLSQITSSKATAHMDKATPHTKSFESDLLEQNRQLLTREAHVLAEEMNKLFRLAGVLNCKALRPDVTDPVKMEELQGSIGLLRLDIQQCLEDFKEYAPLGHLLEDHKLTLDDGEDEPEPEEPTPCRPRVLS